MSKKIVTAKNNNNLLLIGFILIITFLAYLPSLQNEFTNWDDGVYVVENELVKGFTKENFNYWLTAFHHGNYHPITMWSYMLDFHIGNNNGELNPTTYHITNLIFHLLNTFLVFVVVGKIAANKMVGAIASIIFAVHPMHVESVAWVSERKDVLYTFFYLISLNIYLDYVKNPNMRSYILLFVFFVLSLLSKSAAVVLPIVFILVDFIQKRTLDKKSIIEKIPLLIVSFIFGLIAIESQKATEAIADFETFTLFQRFMFACYGFIMYIYKFFVPIGLAAYHPYPFLIDGERLPYIFYFSPLIALVVLGVVLWTLKFTRIIVFGVAFYLINVVLVLQFISVGSAIYAERYSYMAYIGLAYIIGMFIVWLVERKPTSKNMIMGVFAICSFIWAFLTYQQSKTWKDSLSLWAQFNKVHPYHPYGEMKIADYYMNRGDDDFLLAHFQKVVSRFPNTGKAYMGIANIMGKRGNFEEAIKNYDLAFKYNPEIKELHANRAITYSMSKQYDLALADYEIALKRDPNNIKIRTNMAFTLIDAKKFEEAIAAYSYLILVEPKNSNHYFFRAISYQNMKNYDASIKDYTVCIQLSPNYAAAYQNRGICYESKGEFQLALNDILKAQQLGNKINEAYIQKLRGLIN
jgi:protein O-mannosyl-transferase